MTECISRICVESDCALSGLLEVFERESRRYALVVNGQRRLIGIVTEGDVRRYLIAGGRLSSKVSVVMTTNFVSVSAPADRGLVKEAFDASEVDILPVVNSSGQPLALVSREDFWGSIVSGDSQRITEGYVSPIVPFSVVTRKWGYFFSIHKSDVCHSKILYLAPRASISLQYHHQREEHWVIISGRAEIICGDERIKAGPGDYIKIDVGVVHKLINSGEDELMVHELQLGSYFGDDDIVRLSE